MAGQKIYNTLLASTGRSPVIITGSMTVDTSKATNGTAIVTGKHMAYTNVNGVVTVTLPEKFGRVEYIDVMLVDPSKTGNQALINGDYAYPAGTFQFSIVSPAQAAITTGVYKCYILVYVVQSM